MMASLSPQKVDFEKIWGGLADGIGKIVTLTGVKGMPLVEDIYRLCTAQPQPYSEELYIRLKQFLEKHVDKLYEVNFISDLDINYFDTYLFSFIICVYVFPWS